MTDDAATGLVTALTEEQLDEIEKGGVPTSWGNRYLHPSIVPTLVAEIRRLRADNAEKTAATLRFVRQTVHQAHHEGPIERCRKNTCSAVASALGEA